MDLLSVRLSVIRGIVFRSGMVWYLNVNLFSFFRSVLCSVLMYDLKLPNSRQTLSPNRKAFVSKVLPQLTGLQELAREKEMGGSDVSAASAEEKEVKEETKDGSCESDDRKEAIKRLKTSG